MTADRFKNLVLSVRPGAEVVWIAEGWNAPTTGCLIQEKQHKRFIGTVCVTPELAWQRAFEMLPEWEQAKALVLERWPEANADKWDSPDYWQIFPSDESEDELGRGDTPESAWLNAKEAIDK